LLTHPDNQVQDNKGRTRPAMLALIKRENEEALSAALDVFKTFCQENDISLPIPQYLCTDMTNSFHSWPQ